MSAKEQLPPIGHALSGAGGALLALTITYPLDIIKTRLQVQSSSSLPTVAPQKQTSQTNHVSSTSSKRSSSPNAVEILDENDLPNYTSTYDAFTKIFQNEGLAGLYAGLPAGLLGTFSSNFTYFYYYTFLRSSTIRRLNSTNLTTTTELLIGALAGALSQLTTIPVSVVVTRQQTTSKKRRMSFVDTWWDIVNKEGWRALWKGLKPSLVLVINPAITYGLFEPLKKWVMKKGNLKSLTSWQVFLIGATSKTLATVITYPYIMAKVRLQWKPPVELANDPRYKYKGAIDVLSKVLKSDGFFGWYKGMQAQITKAVLSQALLFMIKDQLDRYTLIVFLLMRGVSKNKVQQ